MIISNEAADWFEAVAAELVAQKVKPARGSVALTISFCPPTRRNYDLDNRLKVVMDGLKRAGIISDDSVREVPQIELIHYDKGMQINNVLVEMLELDNGMVP